MVTDKVADLLTRIRNAAQVNYPTVDVPASTYKKRILEVLRDEGYVEDFRDHTDEAGHPAFRIVLKYEQDGKPAFRSLQRMSKPGRRLFKQSKEIPVFRGGLGTVIVSTSKGVMSDRQARGEGLGGELICSVF